MEKNGMRQSVSMGSRQATSRNVSSSECFFTTSQPYLRTPHIIHCMSNFTPTLIRGIRAFWNVHLPLHFVGISETIPYFMRGQSAFVAHIPPAPQASPQTQAFSCEVQVRFSELLCHTLLKRALGNAPSWTPKTPFHLQDLTPFELYLLNRFSKECATWLLSAMAEFETSVLKPIPEAGKKAPARRPSDHASVTAAGTRWTHVCWLLDAMLLTPFAEEKPGIPDSSEEDMPWLMLAVPTDQVERLHAFTASAPSTSTLNTVDGALFSSGFPEHFLLKTHSEVNVHIGKTRLPLEELKSLEHGDLVVLEQSRINQLFLKNPLLNTTATSALLHFSVDPNTLYATLVEIPIDSPSDQDTPLSTIPPDNLPSRESSKDALWNNLMIEVAAEFLPTKLPLKQLKEMSEGSIVEVANLLQNQIRLHVEGQTVATGELVIVGNQFGVLIHQLVNPEDTDASADASAALPQGMQKQELARDASQPLEQQAITASNVQHIAEVAQEPSAEAILEEVDKFLQDEFSQEEEQW
jgi:flagellar motor switch/type III secretory pathway protein FliN